MKQKSANELIGIKGHFFDFIVFLPVLVGKSNPAVINRDDAIVWYGNPMCIAAQILKYLLGTCERTLCIPKTYLTAGDRFNQPKAYIWISPKNTAANYKKIQAVQENCDLT